MAKYRKKPVEVIAMQFTDKDKDRVFHWANEMQMNLQPSFDKDGKPVILIPTLDGEMIASIGDYIVKEPFPTGWRKVYPCKPDIFEKTYESAN